MICKTVSTIEKMIFFFFFFFYDELNFDVDFGHSKYNMCSIARSFKDFGIINTIDMQKSKRYSEYCNSEIYEKYLNKCTDEVSSYRKCLIDRDIFDILLDDSGNLKEIDLNMLGEDKLEKLQNDCINFRTDDCVDFRSRIMILL